MAIGILMVLIGAALIGRSGQLTEWLVSRTGLAGGGDGKTPTVTDVAESVGKGAAKAAAREVKDRLPK